MRNTKSRRIVIPFIQGLLLMAFAPFAAAYIGPGSGISVIGSLLALLATIGLAFLAIVMFPFRKMMKKRGQEADAEDDEDNGVAVAKESAENP
ncbi:MAG: hypothetical protein HKN19_19370 [Halioglobus sp.]|nr:hypothetical protein [Halioglobus sp.]